MTVVVDASVALKTAYREAGTDKARQLFADETVIAPEIVLAEFANVVWRKIRTGDVPLDQALTIIDAAPSLFVELVPAQTLLRQALETGGAAGPSGL